MNPLHGRATAVVAGAGMLASVVTSLAQLIEYLTTGRVHFVLFGASIAGTAILGAITINLRQQARQPDATGQKQPQRKKRKLRVLLSISITTTILSTLVIAGVALAALIVQPPPAAMPATSSPIPTPSITSATPSPTQAQPRAEFSAPAPNSSIRHGSSVPVSGHVSGLGQFTLWLVTKPDAGGGSYYLTDNSPVTTRDGDWRFPDTEVGDASDVGHNITYLAILADQACASALAQAGDPVDSLPAGCTIVATTAVHVT